MANINRINNRKEWFIKSDAELKKVLDELRRERFQRRLDDDLIPYNELLHASFRFKPLMDVLKEADIRRKNVKR